MDCTFQIFLNDTWVNCATVSVQDAARGDPQTPNTFEYDLDYAFAPDVEPLSLRFPVNAELQILDRWPSFLFDLIPQGSGRQFLLGELGLNDGPAADFLLMRAGAFNPIGRVRVEEAVQFYDAHVRKYPASTTDRGFTLEQITGRSDEFNERMLIHSMLAASSLGVQGAAPKYLLTTDQEGKWHADGALADAHAVEHFIVKRPRGKTDADRKVLRNEAAYMRVAAAVGIRTAGALRHHEDTLFIPRFDRVRTHGRVERLHQESAASIAGIVGFNAHPTQFELLASLRSVVSDRTSETIEFLKRDVLNLAMRNTDNHARNTAVQKTRDHVRLTPLFDFAPMYLDPDGIPRAARWHHPATRVELTEWRDVLAALPVDDAERGHIRLALHRFAPQIQALDAHMLAAGVDDDIIRFLRPHIATQVQQLSALGEDQHGSH
ncbi:type II toxin-antitoxin system HipA family toxin [Duganella violaceipulchra]|uniref:Serine/threonine-protein kinase HipA n=1 Tax=Duganella violaceipulchra TaxID=2849652 RepID=A0AA41H5G4_9BURK|nr:type II toxin-antitoxin system HipA family toxin [Duganella violaceicalia]MBV6320519.1 type II toxin-antitoxin system HipA family toxin [Duganella violaceicalia]MCP2008773.1 serine/threonine-protein kinase HipA [Duganella violaceicalia]